MADRRMFSKNITNSGAFLKMSSSARLLYYDLGMNADDDGIVEAFMVMQTTGASEDDFRLLVTKGFIQVLDPENMIVFITHWRENNKIRADRKKDSVYKELLLEKVPDIKLLEPTQRADIKPKEDLDNQWTSNGPHRLGKVNIYITIQYITLFYKYINGEKQNFEDSSEAERKIVTRYLKQLDIYVDKKFDEYITENRRTDYILLYWSIKELASCSSKMYLDNLSSTFLWEKFFKCCEKKDKNDTKDFLDYFIKTLKKELQRISEIKR